MAKFNDIRELARQNARWVSNSPKDWMNYLDVAARLYRYSFKDTLLIHAQRPDATACAELEVWNKKMNRWVNRGAKGIALLDDASPRAKLRYVFDIADTHLVQGGKTPILWRIDYSEHQQMILDHLADTYALTQTDSMNAALMELAQQLTAENLEEAMDGLEYEVADTFLEGLDEDSLRVRFRELMTNSIFYTISRRCGQEPLEVLDDEDFIRIVDFNQLPVLTFLGNAVSEQCEAVLRDIGREMQKIYRKEVTEHLAKTADSLYNTSTDFSALKRETKTNITEGGKPYGTDLSPQGGLPVSEPDRTGQADEHWEVRDAAQDLSEGEQEELVSEYADERQAESASGADRRAGGEPDGRTDREPEREVSGSEQGNRTDGMGGTPEQSDRDGGRDRAEGIGVQLTADTTEQDLSEAEEEIASAFSLSSLPTVEQQIRAIEAPMQAQYADEITIPAEVVDEILRTGSNRSKSQLRLIYNFMTEQTPEEYTAFVKKEYGEGGKGFEIGGTKYAVWFDELGMQIAVGDTVRNDPKNKAFLSWEDVSGRIHQLLQQGEYAPKSVLDAARGNALHEHAEALSYMERDMAEGVAEMVFADTSIFSGGYPELTERLAKLIDQPEFLADLNERLLGLAEAYAEDKSVMRMQFYRPDKVSEQFQKFALPYQSYQAREGFQWNEQKIFITEDEIDAYLAGGGPYSDGRLATYSFFLNHEEKAERTAFLKDRYGVGGSSHALSRADNSHANYDGRGLELARGSYGKPDALVKLNWNQAAERVAKLIDQSLYLKPADYSRMPSYEREQMANRVIGFYHRLPNEVERPFERELLNEDARKKLPVMLADSEQAAELLEKMDAALLSVPLDSPDYAEKSKILADLHQYVEGTYTIFPKKKKAIEISTSETGQISLFDIWAQEQESKEHSTTAVVEEPQKQAAKYSRNIGDYLYLEDDRLYKIERVTDSLIYLKDMERPAWAARVLRPNQYDAELAKNPLNDYLLTGQESALKDSRCVYKECLYTMLDAVQQSEIYPYLRDRDVDADEAEKELRNKIDELLEQNAETAPLYADWSKEYAELKSLLPADEYSEARASTLNAFYTSPTVIKAMYEALSNMGLSKGNVLEPSCGVGNFMGLVPESMENIKMYGVELDSVSGRIAQQLYQKNKIAVQGFETMQFPDSFFDCVVGNVPFGNYKVPDKRYDRHNFLIHDYFIAKSLDLVRPGGVVAVVTSSGTMDKKDSSVREYLANRADLVGAIRLPNNAFQRNANTSVVADILFLQKRDRAAVERAEWVDLGTTPEGYPINQYFAQHPEMVLGEITTESTQYGKQETTVKPIEGADLAQQLKAAVENIHAEITEPEITDDELDQNAEPLPADPNVKNFSYTNVDGQVYYRENSYMNKVDLPAVTAERVLGMIALRETTQKLLDCQLHDGTDAEVELLQEKLKDQYKRFTAQYGLINSTANKRAFRQDSSYCLLASLEILDEDKNLKRLADIFTKRTIRKPEPVTSVDTPSEALALSIGEKAKVDVPFMAELCGKTEQEVTEELAGVIFRNPVTQAWVTADEYLSGNVREKLATAETFAANHPEYQVNVEYLKRVQPKDLNASEIEVRLGANWIKAEYITDFMGQVFKTPGYYIGSSIKATYSEISGAWNISGKSLDRSNPRVTNTYGTMRVNGYRLLEDALNLRDTKIYDTVYEDGKERRVLNKKETMLAQQAQEAIRDAFKQWIFKDLDRREELCKVYNERFNAIRPREYDGSHIKFVGMTPEISLMPHQKNAVAHILYGNNTLLAHCVGAGKTFQMIAAGMESRRLGLTQKNLYVVPNHLTEQWGADFLRLYPNANVLVATKKDFEPANRKKFCSRIATGDYDAIIIGHSQFERIPLSPERQKSMIERQIQDITFAIAEAKAEDDGKSFTVKQMEKTKKILQAKLQKLNDQSRKDDVVTFEQLGVDRLFVDESHFYKNMFLYTKMRNIAGIAQTDAQKSSDMFAKCQYLDEITGGKGVTFATGTPVSNSMVELYTIMRYLQYDTLQKLHLGHFDSWAASFGETVTAIELSPEGTCYRAKTRFARFFNLPELISLFKESADVQTADMLNLPVPEAEYINEVLKPSETQQEMVSSFADRAEQVRNGNVNPKIDNMLKITNDGRKLALDQRLINDLLPDEPESKVNLCVENAYQVWEESTPDKSTQLIFCDLSTPKADETFNVYDDVREKLVAKGIPREEIAFIHEANTETKKAELFAKVRSGQVRILLGSTPKLGAGTNIQDRLIALHHLDCPWKPSDLEQQEGRILRQGNRNQKVKIFRYVTENTFDSYMWQILENKQKFISQIMTSKSPVRACDDVDDTALTYAEIKALATGNPYIKEKMDLDIQVSKLKLMRANHTSQIYSLESDIARRYPAEITAAKERIAGLKADLAVAKPLLEQDKEKFSITVEDRVYADRKEAGSAILAACAAMKIAKTEGQIADLGGFAISSRFDAFAQTFKLTIKRQSSYTIELGSDPAGNIQRILNALASIEKTLPQVERRLETLQQQLAEAKEEVQRPFPQEAELNEKSARLAELNALLDMDEKGDDAALGMDEEVTESEIPAPKREIERSADSVKRPSILAQLHEKQAERMAEPKPQKKKSHDIEL